MSTLTAGANGINMSAFGSANPIGAPNVTATTITATLTSNSLVETYSGTFTVTGSASGTQQLAGGTATDYELDPPAASGGTGDGSGGGGMYNYYALSSNAVYAISGAHVSAAQLNQIFSSHDLNVLLHAFLPGGDTYVGSSVADYLIGMGGNDTFMGGSGTESFQPGPGNNTIVGGSGVDTVVYGGAHTQYSVTRGGTGATVSTPTGTDSLSNVGRIQFADGLLVISGTDPAAEGYRLYNAALGRTPDASGEKFWATTITQGVESPGTGMTLAAAANFFATSAEFIAKYGNLSNDGFINQLYQNVLNRAADPGGLQFWDTYLAQGHTRGDVLVGFSESAENVALVAPQIAQGIFIS